MPGLLPFLSLGREAARFSFAMASDRTDAGSATPGEGDGSRDPSADDPLAIREHAEDSAGGRDCEEDQGIERARGRTGCELARYVREVYAAQDSHRCSYGFTLCGDILRV